MARVGGGLSALRLVARKYEFRDEEERQPLLDIVQAAFPTLLQIFQVRAWAAQTSERGRRGMCACCVQALGGACGSAPVPCWQRQPCSARAWQWTVRAGQRRAARRLAEPAPRMQGQSPQPPTRQALLASDSGSLELAELLKLVCKIFWSCTYLEIPPAMTQPDVVRAWLTCVQSLIVRPLPLVRVARSVWGRACPSAGHGQGAGRRSRCRQARATLPMSGGAGHLQGLAMHQGKRRRAGAGRACSIQSPRLSPGTLIPFSGPNAGRPRCAGDVAVVEDQEVGPAHRVPHVQQVRVAKQ